MITRQLDHDTPLYRVLVPRWSYQPLSGAGAAEHGGRFNRPGTEAFYCSLTGAVALREYQQDSAFLPPGTIVSYLARATVLDLAAAAPGNQGLDPIWQDWDTDWRACVYDQYVEPPTWTMGDMALKEGLTGILFPPVIVSDGLNLVLFPETFETTASLKLIDGEHRLPRGPESWKD